MITEQERKRRLEEEEKVMWKEKGIWY